MWPSRSDGLTGSIDSQVLLVRVGSKSAVPDSEAGPDSDGSFCVTDINPGKYHLLFVNRIEEALTSFRSEEHMSVLQSPCNLVCRLLLEKNPSLPNGRNSSNLLLSLHLFTRPV